MMLHEETRKKISAKWLEKATKDLAVGKLLFKKGKIYFDFTCFHCQQCAEKAVKGFLVWHDTPFRKIHDLVSLGSLCLPIDSSLEETLKSTALLSRYAVDARYPGEDGEEHTKNQTMEALELAGLVLAEILKRLPFETHPTSSAKTIKNGKPGKKNPARKKRKT